VWIPSFREAATVAREEERVMMIYFYEEDCAYCRRMEETVLPDPEVDGLLKRAFVVVPVNVEEIPDDLDRRFRAVGTPSFLFYDPRTDRVLFQLFGVQEKGEFLRFLRKACKSAGVRRC